MTIRRTLLIAGASANVAAASCGGGGGTWADESLAWTNESLHPLPVSGYNPIFDLPPQEQDEHLRRLESRLDDVRKLLLLNGESKIVALAQQLSFGAAISALESFLWETAEYWVENSEPALREMVTKLPVFRDEQVKLGTIFDRHVGLKNHVKGYLQNLVWHRWDKVAPVFKVGLGVAQLPSFRALAIAVEKRHDIVHRSGRDVDGQLTLVSVQEIEVLCEQVLVFAVEINRQLGSRAMAT